MKKMDVMLRHGWLYCLALFLFCSLVVAFKFQVPFVFSDIGWYAGLLAGVVAVFCLAFTLLYGAFLLCFPRKRLIAGANVEYSQSGAAALANSNSNGVRSRPVSNPYERVGSA